MIALKIMQVCVFVPGSLILTWLLLCETYSSDLKHTLMWIITLSEGCTVTDVLTCLHQSLEV